MSDDTKTFAIAYWLLPAEAEAKYFSSEISRLAERFGTAAFAPHLTIWVLPAERPISIPPFREIRLAIEGLCRGNQFTKRLVLQFEKSSALKALAATIAGEEVGIDPHLSLIYADASLPEELEKEIIVPFGEVNFTAVCAMRCALPVLSSEDVRAWKQVAP